jgi:hypothetical protein
MPRFKKTPFNIWETTKSDGIEERYIRMGNSQMLHPSVFSLTHSAFRVYSYMKLESGGKMIFQFPRRKWRAFISNGGFQKAKKELCVKGFIEQIESNANLRKPNVYKFMTDWKNTYW